MIFNTEILQNFCSSVLYAVDTIKMDNENNILHIYNEDNTLNFVVCNDDKTIIFKLDKYESNIDNISCYVSASLFLKLILKLTTDNITINFEETNLKIISNGVYLIPYIENTNYKNNEYNDIIESTEMHSSALKSIGKYNTIELNKNIFTNPVQKLFYMDNSGVITFTTGACINNFITNLNHKLLLDSKLVKLFKLFKNDIIKIDIIKYDISNTITNFKIRFIDNNMTIISHVNCQEQLLNIVPEKIIRNIAIEQYAYNVNISRKNLIQALQRLSLFDTNNISFNRIDFFDSYCKIYDCNSINYEKINYDNSNLQLEEPYGARLSSRELTTIISSITTDTLNISFGNNRNIVLNINDNIQFIVPECEI